MEASYPQKEKYRKYKLYSNEPFFKKLFKFFLYKMHDFRYELKHGKPFNEFGLTMYTGRQGAGKTMAMIEYLEEMRTVFPKAKIVTNFDYKWQDYQLESWEDFLHIRNGEDGVIFAIDEIQNEFSNAKWKDFPEFLLSEVTQQRKQKIKIVATSQVFTRVVKQLREQTFEVVECRTLAGRWTFLKAFDAEDYNMVIDNPEKKMKLHRIWRKNFIQDDLIRNRYDSYAKVERLRDTEFIDRKDRVM